jgi:hypothetical protein
MSPTQKRLEAARLLREAEAEESRARNVLTGAACRELMDSITPGEYGEAGGRFYRAGWIDAEIFIRAHGYQAKSADDLSHMMQQHIAAHPEDP